VADVYDALISRRPYKEAWSPEAAVRELQRMAGSHLDPELVRSFIELYDEGAIDRLTEQIGEAPAADSDPYARAA
jgi:HD-GYP domain-containing protein (c-di-GMP phosphodiesterase class II)